MLNLLNNGFSHKGAVDLPAACFAAWGRLAASLAAADRLGRKAKLIAQPIRFALEHSGSDEVKRCALDCWEGVLRLLLPGALYVALCHSQRARV